MKNKALAYRKVQVLMSLGIKVTSAIKDRLYELSADGRRARALLPSVDYRQLRAGYKVVPVLRHI